MSIVSRSRVVLLAAWVLVARPLPGARAEVVVRFEVELPDRTDVRALHWGVLHAGLELGSGLQRMDGASNRADSPSRSFEARLPARASLPDGEVLALLCINHDGWHSHFPSFGDQHQSVALQRENGQWLARFPRSGWQTRAPSDPGNAITIHYHRFEQDYANASLWTWDEHLVRTPQPNELYPVGRDAFGVVFQLDAAAYGQPGDRIGLLPRLNADWQFKDGPDRLWQPSFGQEVFLVQGREQVYRDRPDVRPRIVSAALDAENRITVRLTHRLPASECRPERFRLTGEDDTSLTIDRVEPLESRDGRTDRFVLVTSVPVDDITQALRVEADGLGACPARIGRILHGSPRYSAPDVTLGATYTKTATTFRVFSPVATRVRVVVADAREGDEDGREYEMRRGGKGVWEAVVEGDLEGRYYAYRLDGVGLDAAVEVTDPYATCTQNSAARSLIVDLRKTDPPGFRDHVYRPPPSRADAVIYELHLRDFTIADNSGVAARGKYLGLAESGTHLPGYLDVKTGLDHLVELGVTHVQLMPIQDFDNDEARADAYNWGYMPVNFNSPDGWYASSVTGPARIREFKQLVQALHERGIGVVMDVVYNHTAHRASFERLVPGYYFRQTAMGAFSNGSGCGNEFMSENPMARKFILDSLKHWVSEYRIDGFRFDLMGLIDLESMKLIRAEMDRIHPGILLYGEPWTGGETPLEPITHHQRIRGTGIGAFNDHFRDAIKGDRDGGAPGFIQVGDRIPGVRQGLLGAIYDWSVDPVDAINYFEAHDNLTAWDKLVQSLPDASDDQRRGMMRLASLVLLTSQGSVFLHSGQEFCRTKQGHANSYNLPDEINRVDWSLKQRHRDVYEYIRGLIAFRKAHPALRLQTRAAVSARASIGAGPNDRCLSYRIDAGGLPGEPAAEILVLLNGGAEPATFPLPAGNWHIHVDAMRAGVEPIGHAVDSARVPAHSGMLLCR